MTIFTFYTNRNSTTTNRIMRRIYNKKYPTKYTPSLKLFHKYIYPKDRPELKATRVIFINKFL